MYRLVLTAGFHHYRAADGGQYRIALKYYVSRINFITRGLIPSASIQGNMPAVNMFRYKFQHSEVDLHVPQLNLPIPE